jgi:hypothetical protein
VAAFDSFQPYLKELQHQDQDLQAIFQYLNYGEWPTHLTKQTMRVPQFITTTFDPEQTSITNNFTPESKKDVKSYAGQQRLSSPN